MLLELRIRDFAIIDRLDLEFGPGLTLLTGETGAGKSIIIDALALVLGDRADPTVVRSGAAQATVEAVFDLNGAPPEITRRLVELGFEVEEGLLVLRREVQAGGRSLGRLNGRTVPAAVLQQVGRYLVDIHGQTENLSLLRPAEQLELLDRYGGLEPARLEFAGLVQRYRRLRAEIDGLRQALADRDRRLELLEFQVNEIRSARLQPGEEERLNEEHLRLSNAEEIRRRVEAAYAALRQGRPGRPPALDLLAEAGMELKVLTEFDRGLASLLSELTDVTERLTDIARALRAYAEAVEADPARLAEVEERLRLIDRLKRKYGPTVADILAYAEKAEAELEQTITGEERLGELEAELAELRTELGRRAQELSRRRREAARRLEAAVGVELEALKLGHTRFQVGFAAEPAPEDEGLPVDGATFAFDATGIDRVEFLVATNPGEPLRPLAKVASGGETARLMLALKVVLAEADPVPTLVFDEVDVGIGGRSGQVVGETLWRLGRHHQVLCISHLPQVAAFADDHLAVGKELAQGRAVVRVRRLGEAERIAELAAMLGGDTAANRRSAWELLTIAREYKGRLTGTGQTARQLPLIR
ncbi:MAG: DNA repair protein RecN [Chloroflexota bacterium]